MTGTRTQPRVTITTVLYNSAASLPRYAAALAAGVSAGRVCVVAVDNASPDDSADLLTRLLPSATIIRSRYNRGFASGCNQAWPLVDSEYWLLLNPDVEAGADAIDTLAQWMDRHPRVALASPLLEDRYGRELNVSRAHDSLWRPLLEVLRLHKLVPEPWRSRLLLSGRRITPDEIVGWVPGAAMIARVSAVRAVGLMDERLFMYGEDREWCWRMAAAGWTIGVCQDVALSHDGGTSAVAAWGQRDRIDREVEGHLRVSRRLRGPAQARMLALVLGLVLWADAINPRLDPHLRDAAKLRGNAYLRRVRKLPDGKPLV